MKPASPSAFLHHPARWLRTAGLAVSALVQAVLLGVVRVYRFALSPWLGSACRFTPTCSRYALEALETHGPWVGSYLASHRVLRCHPWCDGGHDPVPPRASIPSSPSSSSSSVGHHP
jgi:putative membrane protein insertion efficiency factor